MALQIRFTLNDEQEIKYLEIFEALKPTRGTKAVVNNELINDVINRFHKRLIKAASPLDNLRTTLNE